MNSSQLIYDSYLPGALVIYRQANDYSGSSVTLDGSVYDDVWCFFDSAYDNCQLTIDLPCPCLVRFEVGVENISVNSTGGIGCIWVANSLVDPTSIYNINSAGLSWKTRNTNYTSGYSFGQTSLDNGTHYFRPVWKIQTPYIFSMRFAVYLTVTAYRS